MTEEPTKRCSKCGEIKPLSEFYRLGRSPDGRQRWCKPCMLDSSNAARAADPERFRKRDRAYRQNNLARVRERDRLYWRAHPDKKAAKAKRDRERNEQRVRSSKKRYYAANAAEIREKVRLWELANPWKARSLQAKSKARRRMAAHESAAPVEAVDLAAIYERDAGTCGICGLPVSDDDLQFDHIIPLSRGGAHTFENVQVAHRACNIRKKNH